MQVSKPIPYKDTSTEYYAYQDGYKLWYEDAKKEVVAPVDEIMEDIDTLTKWVDMYSTRWDEYRNWIRLCLDKHLKGTTPVEPINQERLSELIEHIIWDFFDRHRLSYSTFDVDNEYSKRKADELVPALREICWEYLGKSLQSESEVAQGEKKDWKRDYIRKIPSSEYVDWLKDNMWRLPQWPFECDRCRTERERRERKTTKLYWTRVDKTNNCNQ